MSLSHSIGALVNDEPAFRNAMYQIAKGLFASDSHVHSGRKFKNYFRRHISHGLHAGGMSNVRLGELRRIAVEEFQKAATE